MPKRSETEQEGVPEQGCGYQPPDPVLLNLIVLVTAKVRNPNFTHFVHGQKNAIKNCCLCSWC